MQPVVLRTERLELSAPTTADVGAIHVACQDADIQRYTTVPSPYTRAHAEEFVERVAAQWADGSHVSWAIRRGGALVGMVGLYRLDGVGFGELGYWISADARGAGLVREACRAVIDWGFASGGEGLGLERIEWRAVVGNTASANAARALGFRFEGTLRRALRNGTGTRADGWIAALLVGDDRRPQEWALATP
jgi:RimJ/RimL family protein N-acetyltransferase